MKLSRMYLVIHFVSLSSSRRCVAKERPILRVYLIPTLSRRMNGMIGRHSTMIRPLAGLLCEYSVILLAIFMLEIFSLRLSKPMMLTLTTTRRVQKSTPNCRMSSARPISAPEMLMDTHRPMPRMRNCIMIIFIAPCSLHRYSDAIP